MVGLLYLLYYVEVLNLKTDYMTSSENTIGFTLIRFGMPDLKLMVLPVCLI